VLSHPEIDYGIIGSAQGPLPLLLSRLQAGLSPADLPGIVCRQGGELVINRPGTLREDFRTLPFPARHLLPNHKYHTVISKRKNFTIMMTAKGCPHSCGFCHVGNIPYSCRPAEGVLEEILDCYQKQGIREIEFFDPAFTVDNKRVKDICRRLIAQNLDLSWACRARVDQVDRELLILMRRAGCRRIYYGIECGSQQMLDQISKGITISQIRETVQLTKDQGILVLGFFLLGGPGETKATIKATVDFALGLDLDYAQFHRAVAKPTTILSDQVKKATGRDYWSDYILGTAAESPLPMPWTDLSLEDVEASVVRAYRRFYFRPARISRMLLGLKSRAELCRYMRSAIGLLRSKSDVSIPQANRGDAP
jgi:radical SAM superfamily enzyme YgiQ (UPF0313 family)